MMFWSANSMNGWRYALMIIAMIAFWVLIVLAVIGHSSTRPDTQLPILTPILLSSSSHSAWPTARSATTDTTHLEWPPGSTVPARRAFTLGTSLWSQRGSVIAETAPSPDRRRTGMPAGSCGTSMVLVPVAETASTA